MTMLTRRTAARQGREGAAELAFLRSHPQHLSNGEESAYRNPALGTLNYIANYSKGLPHTNQLDEVDPAAYRALIKAVSSGAPDAFERIPLGGVGKFVNPQAGLAFDLEGPDAHAVTIPPAPGSMARRTLVRWRSSTGWHYYGMFALRTTAPVLALTLGLIPLRTPRTR
jgi:hypothetical protein